jgi:hypothetical protein
LAKCFGWFTEPQRGRDAGKQSGRAGDHGFWGWWNQLSH